MLVKNKKRWQITIVILLISFVTVFLSLLFSVLTKQNTYDPVHSDAIIVLGHSIDVQDQAPDEWLTKRLESALQLYHDGYANSFIVSGGIGPKDTIPVGVSMANWLVNHGVEENDILIESKAKNTNQNFKFSKAIAEEHSIQSIIVVTNDFHMYRSIMIAEDYFPMVSGYGSHLEMSINKTLAYFKEPLSIIKYKLTRLFLG